MRIKVLSGGRKSIELSLSDAELNFQMKRIGIEEIVPVCRLVEASENGNPLCKFEGQTVKMDEVNFFAKRLDCLTEYERKDNRNLSAKAKAEKYAKITAKTIISSGGGGDAASYGQNAFFYDAAEGILTAVILLIAEYCPSEKRHIVSVFKLIQDLMAPSKVKDRNQLQLLMAKLPDDHKAKWFAGAALNTAEQSMQSVLSTALSRLNTFLDS